MELPAAQRDSLGGPVPESRATSDDRWAEAARELPGGFAGKILEGGLVVFRDKAAAKRFERLCSYGMGWDHEVVQPGLNGKLSELHATLGCLTLPRVEEAVGTLSALADRYRERLEGVPGVGFQVLAPGLRPTPT